jgi:hypothetical protein
MFIASVICDVVNCSASRSPVYAVWGWCAEREWELIQELELMFISLKYRCRETTAFYYHRRDLGFSFLSCGHLISCLLSLGFFSIFLPVLFVFLITASDLDCLFISLSVFFLACHTNLSPIFHLPNLSVLQETRFMLIRLIHGECWCGPAFGRCWTRISAGTPAVLT